MISIKLSHRKIWLSLILLLIPLLAYSRPAPIHHTEKNIKTVSSVNGEFQAVIEKSDIQQGKVIFPPIYRIYIVKKGEEQQHFYVVAYGWKKIPTLSWTQQNNLNVSYSSGTIVHFNDSFYQQSGRINLRFTPEQNATSESNEAAFNFIKQQLEREIYLKVTYLNFLPTKINYLIKIKDDNYQEIGRIKLCKIRCIDLFRKKETKTYKTTILEKDDVQIK